MYEYGSDLYMAFWEGYRTFQNSGGVVDNPYRADDDTYALWKAWTAGYYQAAEDS